MPRYEVARRQLHAMGCGACIAVSATGAAWAQDRSYGYGANQTFTQESNLYRTPKGQPATRDVWSSTGVHGDVAMPLGRQRFYVDGDIRENRYRDNTVLDNRSHEIDVGMDWATAQRLSGKVNYAAGEHLAPFSLDGRARTTRKNILKNRELNALARMGLVTRLSVEASGQRRQIDYSAPEYATLNYEQDQGTLGLRYSPDASLTLGVGVRRAKGRYPRYRLTGPGTYLSDRYTRNDADLLATWKPTGRSTFEGRLSYGRQRNREATQRDFSAATGSLSWSYQPTGKLNLTTRFIRDTGAETRFAESINSAALAAGNDISRLSTGIQLAASYDATAKVRLNAAFNRTQRTLIDTLAASGATGTAGRDNTTAASLGARYAPNRNWSLGCSVARESRSSESTFSYAYRSNIVQCSAEFLVF